MIKRNTLNSNVKVGQSESQPNSPFLTYYYYDNADNKKVQKSKYDLFIYYQIIMAMLCARETDYEPF